MSESSVRGYWDRSSWGANCAGLMKMLTTTLGFSEAAARMRERCPAWRAPMVGTRATRREERSCVRRHARKEASVVWICSGGTVGGSIAEAMARGGKVSGDNRRGRRGMKGGASTDETPQLSHAFEYAQGFCPTPFPLYWKSAE